MRLIDADRIMYNIKNGDNGLYDYAIRCVINEMPTIDAVEIVRCKDCKHRDGTHGQPNILCHKMHDDDFCSYGEKKL